MITRRIFSLASAAAISRGFTAGAPAAETPASASALLDAAKIEAAGQRSMFAIFHASW